MSIKKKFFALAGVVGFIMVVVSCIGYYIAYTNLSKSVDMAIASTTRAEGAGVNAWITSKSEVAKATANLLTNLNGQVNFPQLHSVLGMASNDKDILDVTMGNNGGFVMSWQDGNDTGIFDPRPRPWYQMVKKTNKIFYTNVYNTFLKDGRNIKVVSVAAPFYKDNKFEGAVCVDIALNVLEKQVAKLKYNGYGNGYILQRNGEILATSDNTIKVKNVTEDPTLNANFQEMLQNKNGYFMLDNKGTEEVLSYMTLPTTGWIVLLSVPSKVVFAHIRNLQITYISMAIVGIIIIVLSCLQFSNKIVRIIMNLKKSADEIAKGNLRVADVPLESQDELGDLTIAINTMKSNVKELITKMSMTAEQVAASSQELTASAQQSAEASNHVASTVNDVVNGMSDQMNNIEEAKRDVERVSSDMQSVAVKTKKIADSSNETALAASKGEELMKQAVVKMGNIETSVMDSSDVVQKLGENSQQIGQIVDTIAAIADQTNLLALNAAIEAARAGEHGKGFAVVAEEVRKLAAESQNSAEEIKNRINLIQTDTARAVKAMQDGTVEVQSGTEAIRNVGTQFTSIMQMVNDIKDQMDNINVSVQSVSEGAENIVKAVNSIDEVSRRAVEQTQSISAATEEQSASTEEIASASNSLATMSTELKEATDRFQV